MRGYGVYSTGINSTIINSGIITTTGERGYGIHSDELSDGSTNTNAGEITTSGQSGRGIYSRSANSTNINSGSIETSGFESYGIRSYAKNSININSGKITTTGARGYGIISGGANSTITNSGTIHATGPNSAAIYLGYGEDNSLATNNTVNLLRDSIIVGNIYNEGASGAKLNINLGAGASYAYSVTGPWTVHDLDNRPMVTGSAYAAGIGAQETASQMLYQRTSAITNSLDHRLRDYATGNVNSAPYWLEVYGGNVNRSEGSSNSTTTHFSNNNYGITAGFKLPAEFTPLEFIVNAEQSDLNIDGGNQKIDSTSLMAGFLAPSIAEVGGAKLSAKALVGFANNNGDRKVMTNSTLYNGSQQVTSDFNGTYGVLGTALTKLYPINDNLTADILLGLDLVAERINSYSESAYFAWDSRTLTQFQSRLQGGIEYRFNDKATVFARVGAERRDLMSGEVQDYTIHGTSVSFNTNNKSDTYFTGQLGTRIQLEKRVQFFGVINTVNSSDNVSSVQANLGLRADF